MIVTWYPCQRGTNSIASTDSMGILDYFFRWNGTWKKGRKVTMFSRDCIIELFQNIGHSYWKDWECNFIKH